MAYNPKNLNNIAASKSEANLWIYTDLTALTTDMDADNYFAGAGTYGMQVSDLIILVGSNGAAQGCMTTLTETTSVIAAFIAIGA